MKNQPKPKLTVKKSVKQQNKIEIKKKIPKEKEEKKQKVKIMKFAENKYGITKLRYSSLLFETDFETDSTDEELFHHKKYNKSRENFSQQKEKSHVRRMTQWIKKNESHT